ncbi:hypothetical protein CDAR_188471 [Caerostris darwini]|uniref:Uncharacterized protein n=1 Tax=Caerostris darwini TaxID=1538125 RepID=A0AAV4V734_9ARAC|nr:hypothetical protein CDAR_188341 [Caerostris darwini]GIY65770.1 hypothetical protein CDAR_188471 [Caerostris darwini]
MKPRAAENRDFSFNSFLKISWLQTNEWEGDACDFQPLRSTGECCGSPGAAVCCAWAVRWGCLHKIVLGARKREWKALSFLRKDIKELVSETVVCVNGFSFIQVRHQVMLRLFCAPKAEISVKKCKLDLLKMSHIIRCNGFGTL